ncbi:MAG: PAC2 family protein [candidate division WOR-3 bacterium]
MNFSGNFSKKNQASDWVRWIKKPELNKPELFIIWEKIPGRIGEAAFRAINEKIGLDCIGEIIPQIFYPLNGVDIENDVAYIPHNRFYYSPQLNLVIFKGYEPQVNHYRFIEVIVDYLCPELSISVLYTLNGFVANISYNVTRKLWAVYNENKMKEQMSNYGLYNLTYEGTPAVSSYLLYEAKKRNLLGMSLWCEIPFYLALVDDFQMQRVVLQFLKNKFDLDFNLVAVDRLCEEQKEKILNLRLKDKKVDQYLWSIEMNIALSQEESLYLTNKILEELR